MGGDAEKRVSKKREEKHDKLEDPAEQLKHDCCRCCCLSWHVSEVKDIEYVFLTTHRGNWRRGWIRFIHSRHFQLLLGFLLLLDVLLLFTQIFLDAYFPPCFVVEQSAECHVEGGEGIIAELICLTEEIELLHEVEEYFFLASIFILGIFEVELFLLYMVLGNYGFFRNFANIFDLFVITASLVLEIYLKNTESGNAIGVLIVARVWRMIRIGHGLIYSSDTRRRAVGDLLSVGSDLSIGQQKLADDLENIEDLEEEEIEHQIQENASRKYLEASANLKAHDIEEAPAPKSSSPPPPAAPQAEKSSATSTDSKTTPATKDQSEI